MPIDLGIDFEEFEKMSLPPLITPGKYEFQVETRADETTTMIGRPMWVFYLKIINRPDIPNRSLRYSCQLPWLDVSTGKMDYSNTFALLNLIHGTGLEVRGSQLPDKEVFFGRMGVMTVDQKPRKNDPEMIDNTASIVTKRKGGGVVA